LLSLNWSTNHPVVGRANVVISELTRNAAQAGRLCVQSLNQYSVLRIPGLTPLRGHI